MWSLFSGFQLTKRSRRSVFVKTEHLTTKIHTVTVKFHTTPSALFVWRQQTIRLHCKRLIKLLTVWWKEQLTLPQPSSPYSSYAVLAGHWLMDSVLRNRLAENRSAASLVKVWWAPLQKVTQLVHHSAAEGWLTWWITNNHKWQRKEWGSLKWVSAV